MIEMIGVTTKMVNRLKSRILVALLAAGVAVPLVAQTVSDDGAMPVTNLNLPTTLSTFGKVEPTLRKPTVIVNGEIVTGTDVDHRLALIVLANGGKVEAEELDRLRVQVFRNLIDEILQIQEAKANKIDVPKADIDQSFARVAANFKRSPDQLDAYLRTAGSSARSMRRQIEAEIAWSRLLRRKVEVNVSDAEVNAIMKRLEESKGAPEFHVGEIYLSATAETAAQVEDNLKKIIDQLRQGKSFQAYARQFSEASTAAVGGDLGWIRPVQLRNDALAQAVQEISVGQVAGPIAVPGGYSLLYLQDRRQVLTADPRDAILSLRQMAVSFPATMSNTDAQARATEFAKATQNMGGCGKVEPVAAEFNAEVVDNDQVRVRDLPPPLQEMLLKLQIGEASPPFGSKSEGVRVLVLCGRDDPQSAEGPSFDQIMAGLEDERVNRRAQRYLRDLRRDAVVDYR
jgi:peptidyl-prolyl cis-trans isomerase SurA